VSRPIRSLFLVCWPASWVPPDTQRCPCAADLFCSSTTWAASSAFCKLPTTRNQDVCHHVVYMAFSAIFFAFYVAHRSPPPHGHHQERARHRRGDRLIPGRPGIFQCGGAWFGILLYWRAVGTFKDPNVFATYLLFPGVMLVQGFLLGTHATNSFRWSSVHCSRRFIFGVFPRGMDQLPGFHGMMVALTFILTTCCPDRSRIILITVFGVLGLRSCCHAAFGRRRARFVSGSLHSVKDYDSGEKGALRQPAQQHPPFA